MLFQRRSTQSWRSRLRAMAWPTRSFTRSARYFAKRAVRINASPYAIAMGVACGAFTSFTPLLGLHILLAFAIAYLLRANLIAAAIGTAVGNPLTFPLIWASTFRVGRTVLGQTVEGDAEPNLDGPESISVEEFTGFFEQAWPVAKPMLVGAVPLGLTAATACFFVTYAMAVGYQKARFVRVTAAATQNDAEMRKVTSQ